MILGSDTTETTTGKAGRELADEVGRVSASLVDTARELSGIGGDTDRRGLWTAAREQGVSLYPLAAIFALATAQALNSIGLAGGGGAVLQPDIAATLGVGPSFFVLMGALGQVVALVVPLVTSQLIQQRRLRAIVLIASGLVWSVATMAAGFTPTAALLAVFVLVDTTTSGATGTVEVPLLIDSYPPRMRVRVIAVLRAVGYAGAVVTPALIAVLTGVLELTWRGVYLVTGGLAVLIVLAAIRLRDPGYGHWDAQVVRDVARSRIGIADTEVAVEPRVRLRLGAVYRRLWRIQTLRLSMLGAMVSAVTTPVVVYIAFLYEQRFGFDVTERALIGAAAGGVGIVSLLAFGRLGDRLFQRDPRIVFWGAAGLSLLGTASTTALALTHTPAVAVGASLVTAAFAGLIGPAATLGGIAIIPAPLRNYSAGIYALFSVAVYGLGAVLLTGIGQQYGIATALLAVAIPQAVGAVLSGAAGRHYVADLDRTNRELIEDEVVAARQKAGHPVPLLACRGIDFSYGTRQILFDVDLTVDEGEMVALLGVNGAGKSTLLRVISGLGFPDHGSVRLGGQAITYFDPEQRARAGILQIPGGRAVFDDLTVIENLRLFGHQYGRNKTELAAAIDDCFDQFPQLADRRGYRARLLSGGERQMLGLSRAWLANPRLLLIDELSLGLAPKVIDRLVETLYRINARGTAIVIVEQSIDVALRLADHAYFMKRGTIQFDGPAPELATRTDLLRPVFLTATRPEGGEGGSAT